MNVRVDKSVVMREIFVVYSNPMASPSHYSHIWPTLRRRHHSPTPNRLKSKYE